MRSDEHINGRYNFYKRIHCIKKIEKYYIFTIYGLIF